MWIHVANGCFIGIVTIAMVALAYQYYAWAMRDNLHSTLGLIAIISAGAVMAGGFLSKYSM